MPLRSALVPPRLGVGALASSSIASILQPLVTGGLGAIGLSTATLLLNDDFNGTVNTAPNAALWNHGEFFNALRWDAMVRAEDSFLDGAGNAKLIITNANIGHGVELSSGWLESNMSFGPGTYFEWGNVLLDDGIGHGHTTVWTQTTNGMTGTGGWPNAPDGCEVDAGENAPGFGYQTNVLSGGYGTPNSHTSAIAFGSGSAAASHTYGLLWAPSGYKFLRDGVSSRSDYTAVVGTNTDQVMRFTIEHDFGAGTECYALCDYMRAWSVS